MDHFSNLQNNQQINNKRRLDRLDSCTNLDMQMKFANTSDFSSIKSNDKDYKRKLSLSDFKTNLDNQMKCAKPRLSRQGLKLRKKLLHFEKELNSIEEVDSGSENIKESNLIDQGDSAFYLSLTELDNENDNIQDIRGINENPPSTGSLDREKEEIKESIQKKSHLLTAPKPIQTNALIRIMDNHNLDSNAKYNHLMNEEEILKQSFKIRELKSRLLKKHSSLTVQSNTFNHHEFKDSNLSLNKYAKSSKNVIRKTKTLSENHKDKVDNKNVENYKEEKKDEEFDENDVMTNQNKLPHTYTLLSNYSPRTLSRQQLVVDSNPDNDEEENNDDFQTLQEDANSPFLIEYNSKFIF